MWALAGPCLAVLLILGGRPAALVAAFIVMICYCFDFADNAEFALLSIVMGVIACSGTLLWAGSALGLVHLTTLVIFLGLVGVWVILQFGWLYREEPDMVILLERLLLGCFPLPAVAIITWAGVALGGSLAVAPCLGLALYAAVALYAVPLQSGLGIRAVGGVHGNEGRASAVMCGCLLLLPALAQMVVEHRFLGWNGAGGRGESLMRIAWAAALPWPLMFLLWRRALWWAPAGLRRSLEKTITRGAPIPLLILWETSKSLFLMSAVRLYLQSAPQSPWDSLLASGAVYSLALAFVTQRFGRRGVLAARVLAVLSIRCLGSLLGVALWGWVPLFDLSTLGLSAVVSLLGFGGRAECSAQAAAVAALSSSMLWFLWGTMWRLDFRFSFRCPVLSATASLYGDLSSDDGMSVSLQHVVLWCVLLFALSLGLIAGISALPGRQVSFGAVFSLQALVLLFLEKLLISAKIGDPWSFDGLFPLPLAGLTGLLGAWMAWQVLSGRGVNSMHVWAPGSMNMGKVLAFLMAAVSPAIEGAPGRSYLLTVFPLAALVLAGSAPFALFRWQLGDDVAVPSARPRHPAARVDPQDLPAGPMLPLEGALCIFLMANALWACSRSVIGPLVVALLGAEGRGQVGEASTVMVVASCGILLGLYVLGIVSVHFPNSLTFRRSGTTILLGSMILLAFQPAVDNFPGLWTSAWGGEGNQGSAAHWRELVKQCCGVCIASVVVLGVTRIISPVKTMSRRVMMVTLLGGSSGIWSALSSMTEASAGAVAWSALGAVGTLSCAAMILLEILAPRRARFETRRIPRANEGGGGTRGAGGALRSPRSGSFLLDLYMGAVVFMPLAAIAQAAQLLVFGPVGRLLTGGSPSRGTSAQGAAGFALTIVACSHAVIALAFKVAGSAMSPESRGRAGVGGGGGGGSGVSTAFTRPGGRVEDVWIPIMGNVSAIVAAGCALASCWIYLTGEGYRTLSAIPCCALLFLLQEDGRLLDASTGFAKAIPAAALSATWACTAAHYILLKGMLEPRPLSEWFSFLHLFGGLSGTPVLAAYRGLVHHFQGIYGIMENTRHGESAVALRALSFWTADSMWHPLLNLILLVASLPTHAMLVKSLWGGHGSPPRGSVLMMALPCNLLPLFGDLWSIVFLGLAGLLGGGYQLWRFHERQVAGERFI